MVAFILNEEDPFNGRTKDRATLAEDFKGNRLMVYMVGNDTLDFGTYDEHGMKKEGFRLDKKAVTKLCNFIYSNFNSAGESRYVQK